MRIVLGADGSDGAGAAAELLCRMPLPGGSAVRVASVVETHVWGDTEAGRIAHQERAWRVADAAASALAQSLAKVEITRSVPPGAADTEILRAAEGLRADLIAVGAAGMDSGALGPGRTARSLVHQARAPVLVARPQQHPLRRVILAVDESSYSSNAMDFTTTLPFPPETELTVVHVLRPYTPFAGIAPDDPDGFEREVRDVRRHRQQLAERLLEEAVFRVANRGRQPTWQLPEGDPAEEVLKLVRDADADLIIAGTRGVSLLEGLRLGSVAERLLERAPCSVLLVR